MYAGRSVAFICLLLSQTPAHGQPLISARAGLLQYFEGSVEIDGSALRQDAGRFPALEQGSRLRTNEGRAEVLLAPGVFLWLGRHGAISMVRNQLQDTLIELAEGAAVVRSVDPLPGGSITIVAAGRKVQAALPGLYRVSAQGLVGGSDDLDRWAEKRQKSIAAANLARARVPRVGHRRERARAGPIVSLPAPIGAR